MSVSDPSVEPVSPLLGFVAFDCVYVEGEENKDELIKRGFGMTSVVVSSGGKPCLLLMDEEAIFLSKAKLLVLTRFNSSDNVNIDELWLMINRKRPAFSVKYAVYSHFRNQGFCVKSASNFGMDYSVYRLTPSSSHSEFCVRVITSDMSMECKELSTLTRVMPDVNKMCCLAVVSNFSATQPVAPYDHLFSSHQKQVDMSSISCLSDLSIRFIMVAVRRAPVTKETYRTVAQIQDKYRKSSKLTAPRSRTLANSSNGSGSLPGSASFRKEPKRRRDHTEVRTKEKSTKNAKMWDKLQSAEGEMESRIESHVAVQQTANT